MDKDNNSNTPDTPIQLPEIGSEIKPSTDAPRSHTQPDQVLESGNNQTQAPFSDISAKAPSQESVAPDSTDTSVDNAAKNSFAGETAPDAISDKSALGAAPDTSPLNSSVQSAAAGSEPASPAVQPASSAPSSGSGKKPWQSKGLVAAVIAAMLLMGGSAGAYFGIVVPNQPENVWEKALGNTARGYDALLDKQQSGEDLSSGKVEGDYRVEVDGSAFDGGFQAEYDKKSSKTTFDVGIMGSRINAEILTELSETSQYPDIYAKVDGLDAFQSMAAGTELSGLITQLEDQWLVADRSLFEQMFQSSEASEAAQLSAEDVVALLQSIGEVNRSYVFTTDESKSIFGEVNFIAKEDRNSRATHHYQVTPHKENLKAYVNELGRVISESALYKTYYSEDGDFNTDGLLASIDRLSGTEIVDVWVDSTTKLLHAVRFNDQGEEGEYLEIGLKYTGGSEYPFYLEAKAGNDNVSKLDVTYKEDTNEIKFGLQVTGEYMNMMINATATFSNDTVTIEKPTQAKPVIELIQQLFLGNGFVPGTMSGSVNGLSDLAELENFPLETDF